MRTRKTLTLTFLSRSLGRELKYAGLFEAFVTTRPHNDVVEQANPDQFAALRADPSLVKRLVSEIIRYQSAIIHMRRTALPDTELAGKQISKGDRVIMWYVSGNWDETVIENAHKFDIQRPKVRRHLAFGAGIHRCVGDRLAELQLQILWEEILRRNLRFEITGRPERIYSNFIRGIKHLPVRILA